VSELAKSLALIKEMRANAVAAELAFEASATHPPLPADVLQLSMCEGSVH
jgi:hypothetical protein